MKLQQTIACLLANLALIGNVYAQSNALQNCQTPIGEGVFTGRLTTYGVSSNPPVGNTPVAPNWQNYGFVQTNSTAVQCVNVQNTAPIIRQYAYTAYVLGAQVQLRNQTLANEPQRITEIRVLEP